MNINKKISSIFEDLMESQHAISDNPGYGYHGTVDPKIHNSQRKNSPLNGDEEKARAHHYKKMHGHVRALTGAHPKMVKHYLDSKHGRHLADVHNDNTRKKLATGHVDHYIKKDFHQFKKHYKPEMFESYEGEVDVEEPVRQIDEISTDTLRNYTIKASSDAASHAADAAAASYRAYAPGKSPEESKAEASKSEMHHQKRMKRTAGIVKAVYKMSKDRKSNEAKKQPVSEETESADKKAIYVRAENGKMVLRKIARKQNVVNSGGKEE